MTMMMMMTMTMTMMMMMMMMMMMTTKMTKMLIWLICKRLRPMFSLTSCHLMWFGGHGSLFGFGRWPPLFVIIRCVLWMSEGGSLVNLYHKSFENSQPSQRMNDTSAMYTSLSRPQQQQKKKENNIVMIRKRTWNFVVINMMFQPSQIFLIMIVMIVVMMQHDVLSEN